MTGKDEEQAEKTGNFLKKLGNFLAKQGDFFKRPLCFFPKSKCVFVHPLRFEDAQAHCLVFHIKVSLDGHTVSQSRAFIFCRSSIT